MNEFYFDSTFVSSICKSNRVSLGTQLSQLAIQYCNVIGLKYFSPKQYIKTNTNINILNLTVQYLEKYSSTVQYASTIAGIQGLASSQQTRELLTRGGGRGGGRQWSQKIISSRRQRTSCDFTHALPDWTCKGTFPCLKLCKLKVHLQGTYCTLQKQF